MVQHTISEPAAFWNAANPDRHLTPRSSSTTRSRLPMGPGLYASGKPLSSRSYVICWSPSLGASAAMSTSQLRTGRGSPAPHAYHRPQLRVPQVARRNHRNDTRPRAQSRGLSIAPTGGTRRLHAETAHHSERDGTHRYLLAPRRCPLTRRLLTTCASAASALRQADLARTRTFRARVLNRSPLDWTTVMDTWPVLPVLMSLMVPDFPLCTPPMTWQ